MLFLGCLFAYYAWENKRRDRQDGIVSEDSDAQDIVEDMRNRTDQEILNFRYTL
jgi:hypothetical protein